ncbi:MAG: outer membrane lipoprotein carrier protein LolA [Pseudomonadota bacterium]
MDRRAFLISAAAVAVMAQPARAAIIPLTEISAYFNSFKSAQSAFVQYNADGSRSRGTLYLQRPGRARFEYDSDGALVMAGGGQVAIFDARSNSEPQQFPLKRTPLNLILENRVDLDRSNLVIAHREQDGRTIVTARDPKQPEVGTIDLFFEADPIRFVQWTITDETGARTAVVLTGLDTGVRLTSSLFNIPIEIAKRRP